MFDIPHILLASRSPRRAELLRQIGVVFESVEVAVDETPLSNEAPMDYVRRLALAKARAGLLVPQRLVKPVLGADTIVVCDGQLLGKPRDEADGVAMLQRLSANTHQVYTAVALVTSTSADVRMNVSHVTLRTIHAAEAAEYWASGEPHDKAGGYAIQGYGAVFITHLAGSYSGVMGLPLFETAELLRNVKTT